MKTFIKILIDKHGLLSFKTLATKWIKFGYISIYKVYHGFLSYFFTVRFSCFAGAQGMSAV